MRELTKIKRFDCFPSEEWNKMHIYPRILSFMSKKQWCLKLVSLKYDEIKAEVLKLSKKKQAIHLNLPISIRKTYEVSASLFSHWEPLMYKGLLGT